MSSFRLEWRDFSGGHWVGPVDTDQPRDTYTGVGACVSPADGMLMPAAAIESLSPTGATIQMWGNGQKSRQADWGRPVVCSSVWWPTGFQKNVVVWPYPSGSNMIALTSDGTSATAVTLASDGRVPSASPVVVASSNISAQVYMPAWVSPNATMNVLSVNSGAFSSYALPTRIGILEHWQYWLVGVEHGTNRLRFSDALTYGTAWPSANYIDIGGPSPITALVPVNNQLFVGKANGWYVVTGELGFDTELVRQVEVGVGPQNAAACDSMTGILFERSDFGVTMLAQAGLRHRVVNFRPPTSTTQSTNSPVNAMSRLIVAGGAPDNQGVGTVVSTPVAWVLDGRQWSGLAQPGSFGDAVWARDFSHYRPDSLGVAAEYAWVLVPTAGSGAGPTSASLRRWRTRTPDPIPGSSVSSVRLSEQRRTGAGRDLLDFTVRSAIVEVEIPPNATGTVSVSLQVQMRGCRDSSNDGQLHPVTAQTQAWSAASFGGVRSRPTFALEFGGSPLGNAVIPVVSLTGCKLRRIVLTCDDQDKP